MLKRNHIAAGGTIVALGALAAVAVGANNHDATSGTTPAQAPAPIVRTVVEHRTVKVVRRERPRAKPAAAPGPAAAPPVPAYRPPATQVAAVQTAPAPKPVQTSTSGAGSSGGHEGDDDHEREAEHEGGADD